MTRYAWPARCVLAALVVGALELTPTPAHAATLLAENFDNIATLSGSGWALINNSAPPGLGWFQGNPAVFPAQSGSPNSYVASNFTAAGFDGNISNWLLLPELTLNNTDVLTFYTRANGELPDRLEVRFSANGGSTNVGGTATSVGDFTALLLTINPVLASGGYPTAWAQISVVLSGLAGPTSGRLAFRYFVPDTSINGDYIGIDTVTVTTSDTTPVPEPATLTLLGLGLIGLASRRRWIATERRGAQRQKGA